MSAKLIPVAEMWKCFHFLLSKLVSVESKIQLSCEIWLDNVLKNPITKKPLNALCSHKVYLAQFTGPSSPISFAFRHLLKNTKLKFINLNLDSNLLPNVTHHSDTPATKGLLSKRNSLGDSLVLLLS